MSGLKKNLIRVFVFIALWGISHNFSMAFFDGHYSDNATGSAIYLNSDTDKSEYSDKLWSISVPDKNSTNLVCCNGDSSGIRYDDIIVENRKNEILKPSIVKNIPAVALMDVASAEKSFVVYVNSPPAREVILQSVIRLE